MSCPETSVAAPATHQSSKRSTNAKSNRCRPRKIRIRAGAGFLADIRLLKDALEVAFVRSIESPFSRITGLRLPDGCGLTGKDLAKDLRPLRIPGNNLWPCDWYPLATDRTRYVGEPMAMTWAATRHQAEDLADGVEVAYEGISGTTPLHDEVPDGVFLDYGFERGDVDAAFAARRPRFRGGPSRTRVRRRCRWKDAASSPIGTASA